MPLKANTLFANRYQLVRLLGRGGFSEVWLAKDSYTHLDIAIKVYAPGSGMDTDGLVEFSQELAGVFNLNHTNLLKPTHVDAWEGMPYLILPFCSQGSIVKRVGKMSEEEIWKMMHDVASGLAYLHQHDIVHQDIKPDNILVDDNGNYLITDFGISTKARSTLRKSVAAGTVNAGTMAYMGPERFSKQPTPTRASDIWSFGAMVYELITGIPPFEERGGILQKNGAEIPDINEPVSDNLKQVVEQMMAMEKNDRPTAGQLVEIANTHVNAPAPVEGRKTQRIKPAPVPPVEHKPAAPAQQAKPEQPNRKKRILVWASVLVLLVIAGAAIGVYSIKGHNKPDPKPQITETPIMAEEAIEPQEVIPEDFVLIPGGTLVNYIDDYDETTHPFKPIYRDIPLDSFYIGKYEVTQKKFMEVMPDNPSVQLGDSLPVTDISYAEAAVFCNKLSQQNGYDGFYIFHDDSIAFNPEGNGYRLPTNHEWAYAARDRNTKPYKYAAGDNINEIAWYGPNSNKVLHKVGTKSANKLGIYDMCGNVEEFVWLDDRVKTVYGWVSGGHDKSYYLYIFDENSVGTGGNATIGSDIGFRVVLVPRSIKTNNNVKLSRARKLSGIVEKYRGWEDPAILAYNIGRTYQYGYGVKQDLTEAKRRYKIAANKGNKRANDKLKEIEL